MQGPDGLERQVALFKQIGNDHLASDLFQKTTNFIDRALSNVFSKNSHNTAVKNLIQSIRENPNFGDKYANLAKAQLTSALERGKPLTGRLAAKVLQDIRLTKTEESVRKTNIDINIDTAFEDHSTEFNDMLDEIIGRKFHDGAGDAFSTQDKENILNNVKQSLKNSFRDRSPSLEEMKAKIQSTMTIRCNRDVGRISNQLVKEATTNLTEKINGKLAGLGLDISLSEDVIFMINAKIGKSLGQELSELDHLVNSEDAERVRDRIIDSVCEAFTTVNESDLDEDVCEQINKLMAENVSALPTKDMALSFCQGYDNDVCEDLLDAFEEFDSETTDIFKMANDFFANVEESVIDPDTESRRGKMDTAPMLVLREGLAKLTGQLEDPIQEETMTNVRNFIDKATSLIEESDPLEQDPEISRLDLFTEIVAKGFGLFGEMSAKAFMKENPEIPEGARGMIENVYDEIPLNFQDEALELVKQNCTNGKGLPLNTRIIVTEEGGVKLSFKTTVTLEQESFFEELGSSTTVSSQKFAETNMTKQFVGDLARGEITFKTDVEDSEDVVFTKQEGVDVERSTTEPEVLFEKLKTNCRGNSNEAFALSVLLNQQFPGSVSVPVSNLGLIGMTGGGGVIIGAGLEHGNYEVTNHGNGKYTISYSAKVQTDMVTGGSLEDPDVPVQMVGSEGQTISLGLDFSYTVDLSEIGETCTEQELAGLIEFNTGPDFSLEFVDKV